MSEGDLVTSVIADLLQQPNGTNPFLFIRKSVIAGAVPPTGAYVKPTFYVVSACYAILSIAIVAAFVQRYRRGTLRFYRPVELPRGRLLCLNGSEVFAAFFLVFYLCGQAYIFLFVHAVDESTRLNLRPYLHAPLLLLAYVPLYLGAWGDMAGLISSAYIKQSNERNSRLRSFRTWPIHLFLFLPPLLITALLISCFAIMGHHISNEADAWSDVDAMLASFQQTWNGDRLPLLELGTLIEPATVLAHSWRMGVLWMRIVLGAMAGGLMLIVAIWLPVSVFQLIEVVKHLRVLKSVKAGLTSTITARHTATWNAGLDSHFADDARAIETRSRILIRLCWIQSLSIIGLILLLVYTAYFGLVFCVNPSDIRLHTEWFIGWLLGFHAILLVTGGPANLTFIIKSFQRDPMAAHSASPPEGVTPCEGLTPFQVEDMDPLEVAMKDVPTLGRMPPTVIVHLEREKLG